MVICNSVNNVVLLIYNKSGASMKTSISFKLAKIARKVGYDFHSHNNDAVVAMQREIGELGDSGINFLISIDRDGSWYAESTNVDKIISGGNKQNEIDAMIKDAIFTYYGVDPQHSVNSLLRSTGDTSTVKQMVQMTA